MPTAFNPNANEEVNALEVDGSTVYAGGDFSMIGGLQRNRLAKLSSTSGNAFAGFDPNTSAAGAFGGSVRALAVSGSDVYVGGGFENIGGQPRNYIAKLSAINGNAFSAFNPDSDGPVRTLALSSGALYAGGFFQTIGGQTRKAIAKLSPTSGSAVVGFNANADPGDFAPDIDALTASGDAIYAGGDFVNIGGQPHNFIAKLSATSGNGFLTFDPNPNGRVLALAVSGDVVYAGGLFTTIAGQNRNFIAKLSPGSGNVFSSFNPTLNAGVNALAATSSTLYAGGDFTTINGRPRQGYAQFTGP